MQPILSVTGFAMILAGAAQAQAPAAPPTPDYVTVSASAEIARPIAQVMAKTGGYCDIGAWLKAPCVITGGQDRAFGAVRLIAGRITEVIVGKTATSYTYAQPLAPNAYHGTVEYLPAKGGKATTILYTLFFDISVDADQAAKDKDRATRAALVQRFVDAMKAAAEG